MKTNPNDSINLEQHPVGGKIHNHGLTKREYFAAMAMQGLCANLKELRAEGFRDHEIEEFAVIMANGLIAELNKE
jgi:hypothetical protein